MEYERSGDGYDDEGCDDEGCGDGGCGVEVGNKVVVVRNTVESQVLHTI